MLFCFACHKRMMDDNEKLFEHVPSPGHACKVNFGTIESVIIDKKLVKSMTFRKEASAMPRTCHANGRSAIRLPKM